MHARGSLVYKIIYSAVDEKPGVRDNFLKRMVGARGFEPPTPWSRTFGPEGPTKCSGLDVIRYDSESLHNEFGGTLPLSGEFERIARNSVRNQTAVPVTATVGSTHAANPDAARFP